MASRKRVLLMVLMTAMFVVVVRIYNNSVPMSRDTKDVLDNPEVIDNSLESEDVNMNNDPKKPDQKPVMQLGPIHKPKHDNPDDEYEYNYAIAKMQFDHFRKEVKGGAFGKNDHKGDINKQVVNNYENNDEKNDEKNDESNYENNDENNEDNNDDNNEDNNMDNNKGKDEDQDEYGDDYDYYDDEQAEHLLRLFGHAHTGDKKKRRELIDKLRLWMPRAFPVSYDKDVKKLTGIEVNQIQEKPTNMESSDSIPKSPVLSMNLINDDGLIRNCITGDVIGRIPGNLKTRPFSKRIGKPLKESPEDNLDRAASFNDIFHKKTWGTSWEKDASYIAASGRGATLSWTQEVMASLHSVISQVKSALGKSKVRLLDVPCGDMTWMSRFLETRDDITYIGVDIVSDLVETHKKTYKNHDWTFMALDVVHDDIPGEFDIIFSRTMMQHLYTGDIVKVLQRFSHSGSKYLLMTTYPGEIYNSELLMDENNPGRVHEVNMEIPPYSLVPPLCVQRDGPPLDFEGWKHFLGLWQLPLQQNANCDKVKQFRLMGTQQTIYSCVEWSPYIDLNKK